MKCWKKQLSFKTTTWKQKRLLKWISKKLKRSNSGKNTKIQSTKFYENDKSNARLFYNEIWSETPQTCAVSDGFPIKSRYRKISENPVKNYKKKIKSILIRDFFQKSKLI